MVKIILPKISIELIFQIALVLFVLSFVIRTDHSFDQDLGRHIKLGEIITSTLSIPKTNLFSYTNPDFPFINHHYLFEVVVFLMQKYIGLQSLLYLKVLLFLATVIILIRSFKTGTYLLAFPIAFLFFHLFRERLEFRPELFSFLFTVITVSILNKFEVKTSKLLYLLPLVQLIWVNTHIYFFVGLAIQAIFLISSALNRHKEMVRKQILVFLVSVLVSFINPNTYQTVLYPLTVFQNYGYTIVENQTMFLLESIGFRDPNFIFMKVSVVIVVMTVIGGFYKGLLSLKHLLLILMGSSMALLNVRSLPYMALIVLPSVVATLPKISVKPGLIIINFLIFAALLTESILYITNIYYNYTDSDKRFELSFKSNVQGAMEFVKNNNLTQPIFNNFDVGSYIIYSGYPKYKVFVDGRPESYPSVFFQQQYVPMQSDYQVFKQQDRQYNFQTIIFSHTDQTPWGKSFLSNVVKDPNWKIVYLDDFMIVLIKSDSDYALPIIKLQDVSPNTYSYRLPISYLRMAILLNNFDQSNKMLEFNQRAIELFPDSPLANIIVGNLAKARSPIWW